MIEEDRFYMKRAIELACEGAGLVSPNPLVGSVLVKDGRVVGEGFHRYDLLKHAEINAIEKAGELARGATLYCSLEPCCHHGRTPPCTDALIKAGITRAVVAMTDPDPRVNGFGIKLMREAGIEVEIGLNEIEARRLNEIYLKFITTGSPFIHAVFLEDDDREWCPSPQFSETAFHYDALVLGDNPDVNRAIIRSIAKKARHRPMEIATVKETTPEAMSFPDRMPGVVSFSTPDELRSIIESWRGIGVTSVLVFPSLESPDLLDAIMPADKATLVRSDAENRKARNLLKAVESEVTSGSGHIEVTGYLRIENE